MVLPNDRIKPVNTPESRKMIRWGSGITDREIKTQSGEVPKPPSSRAPKNAVAVQKNADAINLVRTQKSNLEVSNIQPLNVIL